MSMSILNPKTICLLAALAILAAQAARAAEDTIGPTKIPFYTGNLSVYKFMMYWGTFPGPPPSSDWASPEHIAQLKRISVVADCDYPSWALAEQREGTWDFSLYKKNADLLHAAGFKYVVFCWVHFPPKWFMESPEFVAYQCAEHGEKLMQTSPWDPSIWRIYWKFYSEQKLAMGDKIDWIRLALPADYGEIGYPAAMTSWLVPQKHAHAGYWCGDKYARADFRAETKTKFKDLKALNKRWGTSFTSWDKLTYPDVVDEKAAKVARESGKATDRRRWLDFIEWYNGAWLRFTPRLAKLIRGFYPTQPLILSIGYGSEGNKNGNDFSRIVKMAKSAGLATQTPGNVSYYAMKRVSTACHFYGVPYYTEPPGDVPPNAEVARVFSDISNGVQVYFEYPNNLDRARAQLAKYKENMTGAKPIVDLAIYNPCIQHRLDCADGFPIHAYMLGEKGRERFDFDVVDETLVKDGALAKYRLLAYVHGGVTEEAALKKIAAWVKAGGALVTCDLGDVETVEGDRSIWNSLIPAKTPTLDEIRPNGAWDWAKVAAGCSKKVGKGIVIKLPIESDDRDLLPEAVSYINYNLRDFGKGFKNAPLIDGEVDGLSATLLPDRILHFTWLDREVTRTLKLRPEDWANRPKKPERMQYDLKLAPHSIEAIMLK